MSFAPGTRLGPYEIGAQIGVGGMGEVYRAKDTNLGRAVAIKVLPEAFAQDPERLARFEREAKTVASLNHSNIAIIHFLERAGGGVLAIVMELVEGPTLADRIAQGPIPVDEALPIAKQIAEALEAAHEQGIIHRDLKPPNIKLRPDGTVKVLDFGLAKALDHAAPGSDDPALAASPTISPALSLAGTVLGTPAYMSPEQARGKALDKRTDIWAFGCVLYQMLTGRPAFRGETLSDLIVAILERDADWTALPVGTPPAVRRLLQRCLEKDAHRRLRDIGDVRHWLDDVATGEADVGTAAAASSRRSLAWLLGGVAVASAAFAGWSLWVSPAEAPARNVQLQRLTDFVGMEDSPAISPDGKSVAFVARAGSKRQIWQRLLAGGPPLQITRDDADHEQPRWAPDSSSLIYFVPSTTSGEHGRSGRSAPSAARRGGSPRRSAAATSAMTAGASRSFGSKASRSRWWCSRAMALPRTS